VARVMAHPMEALRAASERGEPIPDAAVAVEQLFASCRAKMESASIPSTMASRFAAPVRAQEG
jgi:hypothetical protein